MENKKKILYICLTVLTIVIIGIYFLNSKKEEKMENNVVNITANFNTTIPTISDKNSNDVITPTKTPDVIENEITVE